MCLQAIELISLNYNEDLDQSFKVLRISANYKGRDETGNAKIRPFAVPDKEAFYVLKQMMTHPDDADIARSRNSSTSRKNETKTSGEKYVCIF